MTKDETIKEAQDEGIRVCICARCGTDYDINDKLAWSIIRTGLCDNCLSKDLPDKTIFADLSTFSYRNSYGKTDSYLIIHLSNFYLSTSNSILCITRMIPTTLKDYRNSYGKLFKK